MNRITPNAKLKFKGKSWVSATEESDTKEFTFNPQAKTICFFPADVHHKILPNHSNEVRLSLAFNLFPSGQLGNSDSDSFVNVKVNEKA